MALLMLTYSYTQSFQASDAQIKMVDDAKRCGKTVGGLYGSQNAPDSDERILCAKVAKLHEAASEFFGADGFGVMDHFKITSNGAKLTQIQWDEMEHRALDQELDCVLFEGAVHRVGAMRIMCRKWKAAADAAVYQRRRENGGPGAGAGSYQKKQKLARDST